MEVNELKTLARRLLATTRPLAMGPNTYTSLFARVVEGTFRRNYFTLYTIVYLADHNSPEGRTTFGTSCMDLYRRVLEDFISLKYIIFKGKEEYARKFMNFSAVEEKRDMDYLEAAGAPIDPQIKNTTDENYEKVKDQFLDNSNRARRRAWDELTEFLKLQGKIDQQWEQKIDEEFKRRYPNINGQPRKAWAGKDVEGMIDELMRDQVISVSERSIIIQTYLMGNSRNHFSPTNIRAFLHAELLNVTGESDLEMSLLFTTTLVTHMANIFADEFNIPEDKKQAIAEIWQELSTAHLSEEE